MAALHVAVGRQGKGPVALLGDAGQPSDPCGAALLSAEAGGGAAGTPALVQAQEAVRVAAPSWRAPGWPVAEAQIAAEAAREARRAPRRGAGPNAAQISAAALDDLDAAARRRARALARSHANAGAVGHRRSRCSSRRDRGHAALEAAQIEHDLPAQSDLSRGEVRAPIVGTVLEDLRAAPANDAGTEGCGHHEARPTAWWPGAEVFQLDIGQGLRLGQRVVVTAAAIDAPLVGHVERVGLLVGRQNLVERRDTAAKHRCPRWSEVIVAAGPGELLHARRICRTSRRSPGSARRNKVVTRLLERLLGAPAGGAGCSSPIRAGGWRLRSRGFAFANVLVSCATGRVGRR